MSNINYNKDIKLLNDIQPINPDEIVLERFDFINYRKGTLNIVAARPGNGKTDYLLNIVESVATIVDPVTDVPTFNSVIFSLEMDENSIACRLKAINSEWYDSLLQGKYSNTFMISTKLSMVNVADMKNACEFIEAKIGKKLDFVFIDYIQLIEGEQVTNSVEVTKWAADNNYIVVAAAQLNGGFTLEKIKEAGAFISGSGRYYKDLTTLTVLVKGKERGELWLDVGKNRFGPTLDAPVLFKSNNHKIEGKTNLLPSTVYVEADVVRHQAAQFLLINSFDSYAGQVIYHAPEGDAKVAPLTLGNLVKIHNKLQFYIIGSMATQVNNKKGCILDLQDMDNLNEVLEDYYFYEMGVATESMNPTQYKEYEKWVKTKLKQARLECLAFLEENKLIIDDLTAAIKHNKMLQDDLSTFKFLDFNDTDIINREFTKKCVRLATALSLRDGKSHTQFPTPPKA